MEFLRIVVAVLALFLFCALAKQLLKLAWLAVSGGLSFGRRCRLFEKGPDEVTPLPILDMGEITTYYAVLGKDRFGRKIFCSPQPDGSVGYFYFDREASEARRLERKSARTTIVRPRPAMAPLTLGWKGFTEDSKAWEVLGVARDASIREIKSAYRKLIANFHPDRFGNLSDAEMAELERDTKIINAAYSKLVRS